MVNSIENENFAITSEARELLAIIRSISEANQRKLLAYLQGYKLGKGFKLLYRQEKSNEKE